MITNALTRLTRVMLGVTQFTYTIKNSDCLGAADSRKRFAPISSLSLQPIAMLDNAGLSRPPCLALSQNKCINERQTRDLYGSGAT